MSIDTRIKLFVGFSVTAFVLFLTAVWAPEEIAPRIAGTGGVMMPMVIGSGIALMIGLDDESPAEKRIRKENRAQVKADAIGR